MIHRTFKQIGHGGQADVRMRTHIVVGVNRHVDRTEMVEEDKRPHRLLDRGRQVAAHDKAAAQVFFVALQQVRDGHGLFAQRGGDFGGHGRHQLVDRAFLRGGQQFGALGLGQVAGQVQRGGQAVVRPGVPRWRRGPC
jgi:hypothetical protein